MSDRFATALITAFLFGLLVYWFVFSSTAQAVCYSADNIAGVAPDDGQDDGAALTAYVLTSQGEDCLQFSAGKYEFSITGRTTGTAGSFFIVDGITNYTFEGVAGTVFEVTDLDRTVQEDAYKQRFFRIENSSDITVQNFTFTMDVPHFVWGEILSVGTNTFRFQLRSPSVAPPTLPGGNWMLESIYDAENDGTAVGLWEWYPKGNDTLYTVSQVSGDTYDIDIPGVSVSQLQVGRTVIFRHWDRALTLYNNTESTDLTIRNLTVNRWPGATISGDTAAGFLIEDYTVVPTGGEPTSIAGDTLWQRHLRDGTNSTDGGTYGLRVDRMTVTGLGDDVVNVHRYRNNVVPGSISGNQLQTVDPAWTRYLDVGQKVFFANATGVVLNPTTTITLTAIDAPRTLLTFSASVPTDAAMLAEAVTPIITLDNITATSVRSRALLIQQGATVRDANISKIGNAGIAAVGDKPITGEFGYLERFVLLDSTITDVNRAPNSKHSAGAVQLNYFTDPYVSPGEPLPVHRDVTINNVFIQNSPNAGMVISNVDTGSVSNVTFVNTASNPDPSNPQNPANSFVFYVKNSNDLTLSGNNFTAQCGPNLTGTVTGCVAPPTTYPEYDRNDYRAFYQMPVLHPGDDLDPNWSGVIQADHNVSGRSYLAPVNIPDYSNVSCSGSSGPDPDPNIGYVIRDTGGLSELESSNPREPIVSCVGDYRSGAGGEIDISDSGTSRTDSGLIKVICMAPDIRKNPFERVTNPYPYPFQTNHDPTQECLFPRVDMQGNNYWFFENVTLAENTWQGGAARAVLDMEDSTGVVFNQGWIDCSFYEVNVSQNGGPCIRTHDSEDNIVQNSVIGPQAPQYESETICLEVHEYADRIRVINNYAFDCGHNLRTGTNNTGGNGVGSILENNDTILTKKMRLNSLGADDGEWFARGVYCANRSGSSCNGPDASSLSQRRFDASSDPVRQLFDENAHDAGCGQSVLGIKHGSQDPNNPLLVINNRLSGRRASFVHCAAAQLGRDGHLSTLQVNPENTIYMNNTLFDMRSGLQVAGFNQQSPNYTNIKVIQNRFVPASFDDSAQPYNDWSILSFNPDGPYDFEYSFNTFGPIRGVSNVYSDPVSRNTNIGSIDWHCNVFYNANMTNNSNDGQDNIVIDGNLPSGFSNTLSLSEAAANRTSRTIWINLRSGQPEQLTLPDMVWSDTSPSSVLDHCTR